MDLPILTKVLAQGNVDSSGPEILTAIILVIHTSNFEIMDKIKDNLTANNLYDFPGENVDLYCDHQLGLLQQLADDVFLQPQH